MITQALSIGGRVCTTQNIALTRTYDQYNPLNLPPNTIRVRTSDGNVPSRVRDFTTYETATLVDGTTDVYDVYKGGKFGLILFYSENVIEILGANTTNVTDMQNAFIGCPITSVALFDTSNVTDMLHTFMYCEFSSLPEFDLSNVRRATGMFSDCTSLTNIPQFDTSNVTSTSSMFRNCTSLSSTPLLDLSNVTVADLMYYKCSALTAIPQFNTSKITNADYMFLGCVSVNSGALNLYQQMSTQTTPPSSHYGTFSACGRDTVNGAAELAQIPSDWK